MNHNSRYDEGVGADHEVNSPKNQLDDIGVGKTEPRQAFRPT